MMTNTNTMAAQIPSAFGMPTYGCAHIARTDVLPVPPTCVVAGENSVLRDRKVAITGDLGFGQNSFRGTNAWRPPIC
jgi:hypothetical protein